MIKMAIRVKGLESTTSKYYIGDTYLFVDSDGDVFIVGEEETIIRLNSTFPEYHYGEGDTVEEFLEGHFGTTLVKAYRNLDNFDIDITLK
jgi:hypothetical protein